MIFDGVKVNFFLEEASQEEDHHANENSALVMSANTLSMGVTLDDRITDVVILIDAVSIVDKNGVELFIKEKKYN